MQFLSFFGLHDGLGWDLVTYNNILLLLLHPRRRSSYCIIATSWYVWWSTSAGATLVLHLHTTDVCTLRMSLILFLSHQVHAWAWRKTWDTWMLLVFSAAWQTFSEDATSLLAFCIEEKHHCRHRQQTKTRNRAIAVIWLRHIHHQNVILAHGEIWAVNRVV